MIFLLYFVDGSYMTINYIDFGLLSNTFFVVV